MLLLDGLNALERAYDEGVRWIIVAAALAAVPVAAAAAEPVAARWATWSPDGRFVAELDPGRMETAVYRIDAVGARHYEWSMPGWFGHAALANGGDHFVVGSEEGGVVHADWHPADVVLRFYERGLLVRAITLSELVPDPTEMIRVESHFYWGRTKGFDAAGHYVVETIDHVWLFAPETGERM